MTGFSQSTCKETTFSPISHKYLSTRYTGCVKAPGESTECTVHDVEEKIIEWLRNYSALHSVKFQSAGIGIHESKEFCRRRGEIHITKRRDLNHTPTAFPRMLSESSTPPDDALLNGLKLPLFPAEVWPKLCPPEIDSEKSRLKLPVRLWKEMDILPFLVPTYGSTIDERACQAVRKMTRAIAPSVVGNIPQMFTGPRHEVEVDFKGMIRMNDVEDYTETLSDPSLWKVLTDLVDISEARGLSLCFFSSTNQGGGVALMRHALVRLLRLLEVDVHWFVAKPRPEVFDITKKKFHNVLQGVAPPGSRLTEEDKALYESCHIEVRKDLVEDPTTQAFTNWNYLWNFIKECDVFVSHPVTDFAPACVPKEKLFFMGASTDLLDGLNKCLAETDMEFYRVAFNRISLDQTGKRADFWHRPYIVQICRFDPSKGLPDVLKAYLVFRKSVDGCMPLLKIPQLIIAGAGSVDDPEASTVFDSLLEFLEDEMFEGIRHDVILARLPPCDQILNTLMRGAWVALQLSIREGFEIKVTEAQVKGIPVIAYASGGIPLQVENSKTGYLVCTGDYKAVAKHLVELLENNKLHQTMKEHTRLKRDDGVFTVSFAHDFSKRQSLMDFKVGVAINWLYLANCIAPAMDAQNGCFGCLKVLEGVLDNANTWDLVAPRLVKDLDLHIISIDLPGHGKSQQLPPGSLYYPWELTGTILDVAETLGKREFFFSSSTQWHANLTALNISEGWKQFNILGHSRGAHLAFLFTGCFPDRICRFIAIESIGFTNHFEDDAKELATFLTKRRQANLSQAFSSEFINHESGQDSPAMHFGKSLFDSIDQAARTRMRGENAVTFNAAMRLCERGVVKVRACVLVTTPSSTVVNDQIVRSSCQVGDPSPENETEWRDMYTWSTDKRLMFRTFIRWENSAITQIVTRSRARILLVFGMESTLWGVQSVGRKSELFGARLEALRERPADRMVAVSGPPPFSVVDLPGGHHLHLEEETAGAVTEAICAWLSDAK
ncbi:hypothetical protein HDU67_007707 [Dinochytrium kinnereticum]|nr:hypothetical protein HDU67_007707 [Dinochytrium kinnereticum]